MVGITSVSEGQIEQFLDETGITYPILQDQSSGGNGPGGFGGVVYDQYYIPNQGSPYPRDFIIDQNGILVYANNEVDTQYMLYILDELLEPEFEVEIFMDDTNLIENTQVLPAYPNPFNPYTNISYYLPDDTFVRINIFDILGNKVKSYFNNEQRAGMKSIQWDGKNNDGYPVGAGIYLYQIQIEESVYNQKLILLK
tara:strand:+ start:1917 stop:2507 length:591 start_codon:yes stop_codon:yes gene_type:complete